VSAVTSSDSRLPRTLPDAALVSVSRPIIGRPGSSRRPVERVESTRHLAPYASERGLAVRQLDFSDGLAVKCFR
jgi:hypothetical protein